MMKVKGAYLVAVVAICVCCVGLATVQERREGSKAQQLIAADKAFAKETEQRGLEGWLSYYAEDAVRLELKSGNHTQGIEGIRAMDAPLFADQTVKLRWDPQTSGLYGSGDLGFTTGAYEVVKIDDTAEDTVLSKGRYLTIWRQDGQQWKVILDTGTPDSEPEPRLPE
jgi:ketosteroid isomerase-like protein